MPLYYILGLIVTSSVVSAFVKYEELIAIEVPTAAQCAGGYFAYDGNFCKYYQCQANDAFDSGFEAYERWCMKPLKFDPKTCSCQWPSNIEGGGDYECHEDEEDSPTVIDLEECDVRGTFDQCCQPCISYFDPLFPEFPGHDCSMGKGPAYTAWENMTGYTYCDEGHACPEGETFDIAKCRCTSTIWFVDCYYFPFWENGTPLEDETNSGIMGPGDCTVRPNDRNGLGCDGDGAPATLDMMQKQWLGRGWAIGVAFDNAGEGVLVSNGDDDVPASIEFIKENTGAGMFLQVRLFGEQGNVELSVPYITDGVKRYIVYMNDRGYISLINEDMDEDSANPPFTWALEGTKLPLQFGISPVFITDVLVCYFPPTTQGAVDWVFGGPPPSPPLIGV
ncbi:unnamed protein product [Owenia fusiformis]|uniref:Uncharacterized protein n=1 Tax=Owenia fusiformis TaxID=6347 RepID=A0A8S4Q7F1_OWEFU|nr:unnamed protein product [Owenia fusiformis]